MLVLYLFIIIISCRSSLELNCRPPSTLLFFRSRVLVRQPCRSWEKNTWQLLQVVACFCYRIISYRSETTSCSFHSGTCLYSCFQRESTQSLPPALLPSLLPPAERHRFTKRDSRLSEDLYHYLSLACPNSSF